MTAPKENTRQRRALLMKAHASSVSGGSTQPPRHQTLLTTVLTVLRANIQKSTRQPHLQIVSNVSKANTLKPSERGHACFVSTVLQESFVQRQVPTIRTIASTVSQASILKTTRACRLRTVASGVQPENFLISLVQTTTLLVSCARQENTRVC